MSSVDHICRVLGVKPGEKESALSFLNQVRAIDFDQLEQLFFVEFCFSPKLFAQLERFGENLDIQVEQLKQELRSMVHARAFKYKGIAFEDTSLSFSVALMLPGKSCQKGSSVIGEVLPKLIDTDGWLHQILDVIDHKHGSISSYVHFGSSDLFGTNEAMDIFLAMADDSSSGALRNGGLVYAIDCVRKIVAVHRLLARARSVKVFYQQLTIDIIEMVMADDLSGARERFNSYVRLGWVDPDIFTFQILSSVADRLVSQRLPVSELEEEVFEDRELPADAHVKLLDILARGMACNRDVVPRISLHYLDEKEREFVIRACYTKLPSLSPKQ